MIQTWILRSDVNPVEAVNNGDDYSICGDCPHRKNDKGERSCYVNVGQAPNAVFKSFKKLESILVTATLITVTFSVGVVFVSVLMVIPR